MIILLYKRNEARELVAVNLEEAELAVYV